MFKTQCLIFGVHVCVCVCGVCRGGGGGGGGGACVRAYTITTLCKLQGCLICTFSYIERLQLFFEFKKTQCVVLSALMWYMFNPELK